MGSVGEGGAVRCWGNGDDGNLGGGRQLRAAAKKRPGAAAGLSERSKIPRACACRSLSAYFAAICELWPARSFQVLFCRRNVSVEITVLD